MNALAVLAVLGGLGLLIAPHLPREARWVRWLLIVASIGVNLSYTLWRVLGLGELPLGGYAFACYALFCMEMIATYMAMRDVMLLKSSVDRTPQVERQLDWYGNDAPRVDIFIATYNESWEVLEKTIVGATGQNYPHYAVWILDDGNRPWLAEKAEQSGVGYVTRAENTHYKAGNLNNGIRELRRRGVELELIAVLDADFVAWPEFLRRTTALMREPDVGIVQTPQCFYNPDPHQQVFGGVRFWPDEQRGWFDVYLPALDAMGAATCCGTSCLLRMKALDAIGGVPTASVCEDTLTSLSMGRAGFRTVMLNERLTVGLAPEGLGEFLTQRARWLLGGVQNTRWMGAAPGLSGRIHYWLALWRSAIFGIMPPIWVTLSITFWLTGVSLIPVRSFDEAVTFFGPIWLVRFFQGWLFRGRMLVFVSDAIWMLLSPVWVRETYRAIVGSKARFKVTDKAQHRDQKKIHWGLLPFHGTLLILLLGGLVYNWVDPTAPAHHAGFLQANTVMSVWFILVILAGIAPVIESPKRRAGERYSTRETAELDQDGTLRGCQVKDLALGGALLQLEDGQAPSRARLRLQGLPPVESRLVRQRGKLAAFAFESTELRPQLIRRLYCSGDYIHWPERWSLTTSLAAFVRRFLF